jgi:aminoglycoside 2''-phosphotransferase
MNEIEKLILQLRPDFPVKSIELLGEGDFCRAFLVNRQTVFRFSRHDAARASLRRENCLLPQIANLFELQIPQPAFASLDAAPEQSFIAYPFLTDNALTVEKYEMLGDRERTRCAEQVAEFLNQMHAADLAIARSCGVLDDDAQLKYLDLINDLTDIAGGNLSAADFDFAEREINRYSGYLKKETFAPALLHGDLSPDHVLFDGAEVTAIIDFGDVMIGDPARDFLWIYEDYGLDFFRRAIAKYRAADKESLVDRVKMFSNLEALCWVAEALKNGEKDLTEAQAHLKLLRENQN